ncbi:MAG: hypothetical protein HZA04_01660 [Nitrospinae bacterium]|nr:hypothetical protein [Nitrospinota bacterium]
MAGEDLSILDRDEALLASVLVKNKLVPEGAVDEFARHKRTVLESGKPYLGEVLIELKYLTQADIDQYMKEYEADHNEFLDMLGKEGYLSPEQMKEIKAKRDETGHDLISLVSELNIMTKESYARIFNKRSNSLRLGEWLLTNRKLTQEQLDAALKVRNITRLDEYLVHRQYCTQQTLNRVKEKIAAISA